MTLKVSTARLGGGDAQRAEGARSEAAWSGARDGAVPDVFGKSDPKGNEREPLTEAAPCAVAVGFLSERPMGEPCSSGGSSPAREPAT